MKAFFKRRWDNHCKRQQKRADYILLNTLSERELRDIGISRSQIQGIVYGENTDGKVTTVS